jgi:hypothetical protein
MRIWAVRTKNFNFVIPWTLKRTSKLQAKPSALKRERPALQNKEFLHIALFLRIIFALLDPDLAEQNQCGSMRIRILIHKDHNTCISNVFTDN